MSESSDVPPKGGLSRRNFLKAIGTTAVATAAAQATSVAQELQKHNDEKVHGPGAVPISLKINGETKLFEVEPRVTLLDLLRNRTDLTGTKEVCDRGTCGACTVWLDGTPVYSCMTLAIEAQRWEITTIEGLAKGGELTSVQKAFISCDGLQCGFCTPGFVMSVSALLKTNPKPTEEDVRKACSGNLCRCGTYPRVFAAALEAAGVKTASRAEVVRIS
ncbi:MAG: (2Fe-2S)-binding protein [Verrucomicrobiota bacterium]|nr:(2Fe-2S)-binding protein [Verrucomicrobiota bacterium]